MKTSGTEAKNRILNELSGKLSKSIAKQQIPALIDFVDDFYLNVPVDDLRERALEELVSQTLQAWKFIQSYDGKAPKIAIVNPDVESSNWQAGHTIVMVLQKDMPFLSDSVRMEFSRNEIGVHAVQNVVQIASRDSRGKLIKRVRRDFDDVADGIFEAQALEAILYFEIDRQAIVENEENPLENRLIDVLKDLQLVVDDFVSMKARAMDIIKELELTPPQVPVEEVKEGIAFLQWLLDHNFTFLGYKEYELSKKQKRTHIAALPECSLGIVKRKQKSQHSKCLESLDPQAQQFVLRPQLLSFAKSGTLSTVHRPVYPDYVAFRRFNKKGEVIGERGFLGLYTLPVYTERIREIPVLRLKAQQIMRRSGLHPLSHEGKELARILETYPRDELFQTDTDELYAMASRISQIKERHQVKLFVRRDHYGKFITCFVYLPREAYNTDLRKKIQGFLCNTFSALNVEFNTYFGESVLVRTRFTLRTDPDKALDYDIELLEREIGQIARSWQDALAESLIVKYGEQKGLALAGMFREGFPSDYRENFSVDTAVADIARLECIEDDKSLAMHLYQVTDWDSSTTNLALYHANSPIPLSDVIPIMENMGLHVTGEHPYRIRGRDKSIFWKHDFQVIYDRDAVIDAAEGGERFTTAFTQVWCGIAGNDCFNKLVLAAGAGWREVMLFRACAHYLKQIKLGLSRDFITETFLNNIAYAKLIVEYFKTKFDPELNLSNGARAGRLQKIEQTCLGLLENIAGLSEDLVLRRYLELCKALLRTNYFQLDERGLPKEYMSFKIAPAMIPAVPQPVPMFEIFVFSEQVEGVHLRAGKVARGGLRWSDRVEDYRTEVLGLVKAQQVKNAVIVPVGAKGGFVARRAGSIVNRRDFLEEGISSYKVFISGLLDITDNLLLDKPAPPVNVLRYDEDDTYLVVAADKGTASFSDTSNNIAADYKFWLGDAFASGGSRGYDHKGMGITARGAWISVQRHFRERGIDVQNTDFTVVGIGDMGGDVFGNGMLLSGHIKLLAAFNHLHIFVDPNPDPEKSFTERQRLFTAEQSGWSEYNKQLISKGGGIFLRTAKSIHITAEMKECFGIQAASLTPNDLLKAILRAKIDLIWNGGIGTYVKSSAESDEDVGDRSNDAVRV
ncbi:MAG: NAD-glutamate dehydrogenase domain-containing protein, partial [Pseudomonadales bacterium]